MNLQEMLCTQFCGALTVRKVPSGFAIGVGYWDGDGDALGFYVVGPDTNGKFRIEDDGLSIPEMEAGGVDLSSKTRREALNTLMDEYGVLFDEDRGELTTEPLQESQLAAASLRFMAFLLRVQDLLLLTQERVASTFREDAMALLKKQLAGRARIIESYVVHEDLRDYPSDVGIESGGRAPVALFFGTSEAKLYEALLLHSYAENRGVNCSVVALLESFKGIGNKMRQRAVNHLDAVPVFRGGEEEAIRKVAKMATGDNL